MSPNVAVPVSVFADELYQALHGWTERAYSNLVSNNELDRGGHFAAWQEPPLFTEELRAGFRSHRWLSRKTGGSSSGRPVSAEVRGRPVQRYGPRRRRASSHYFASVVRSTAAASTARIAIGSSHQTL